MHQWNDSWKHWMLFWMSSSHGCYFVPLTVGWGEFLMFSLSTSSIQMGVCSSSRHISILHWLFRLMRTSCTRSKTWDTMLCWMRCIQYHATTHNGQWQPLLFYRLHWSLWFAFLHLQDLSSWLILQYCSTKVQSIICDYEQWHDL